MDEKPHRIKINSQGYDRTGKYFGTGPNIYEYYSENKSISEYYAVFRARTYNEACKLVKVVPCSWLNSYQFRIQNNKVEYNTSGKWNLFPEYYKIKE